MSNNILEFTPKNKRKHKETSVKWYGVGLTVSLPMALCFAVDEIENIESFGRLGDFIDNLGVEATKDLFADGIEHAIKDVDIFNEEEYRDIPIDLVIADSADELREKYKAKDYAPENVPPNPILDTKEFIKWGERPENEAFAKAIALDIAKACVTLAKEKTFYA